MRIVALDTVDHTALDALLDEVFGHDRHQRTAYRIRTGTAAIPALSAAMIDDTGLAGSIQGWPVVLHADDGPMVPLVMIGPVAVRPDRQNQGIGRALIAHCLARADAAGHAPQMLIGDAPYYAPFAFDSSATARWRTPGPVARDRLLVRNLAGTPLPATGMLGPR